MKAKKSKWGNVVIFAKHNDDFIWFCEWSTHVPKREGEMVPIFCTDPHEAMQFVYPVKARAVVQQIRDAFGIETFICPADAMYSDVAKRLFDAIRLS